MAHFTVVALLTCLLSAMDLGSATDFCQGSCPSGWTSFSGRCFQLISTQKTWADSEKHCVSLGGNLASVHSVDEHQFIKDLIKRADPAESPTWIRLTNCQQNNVWLWTTGEKVDFTQWNTGEPNSVKDAEHCVHTNWGSQKGWNDFPCNGIYQSVCVQRKP